MARRPIIDEKRTTKSFSGCWTCRARRIKCDEARPACYQCSSRDFACEGYGVRLQWIVETGDPSSGSCGLSSSAGRRCRRSKVPFFDVDQEPLQSYEIEDIVALVDGFQVEPEVTTEQSLFSHGFGVFTVPSSPNTISTPLIPQVDEGVDWPPYVDPQLFLQPDGEPFSHQDAKESSPVLDDDGFSGSGHLFDDDGSYRVPETDSPGTTSVWLPDQEPPTTQEMTTDVVRITPHHTPSSPRRHSLASTLSIPSLDPLPLSDMERFLMHHYTNRIVNLFCVIDYQKSPWKQIHLPRALQSFGEVAVGNGSSSIRAALRNALLSISAFCLSNDGALRKRDHEAAAWAREATLYRGTAIKLLKEAVEKDFHSPSRPGYKELLATMLSMVTINVMSGDTSTCKVHLDGAFRLMRYARSWKTKYSAKARSLHRIYFYLRTIYESTSVDDADREHASPESDVAVLNVSDPPTPPVGHNALDPFAFSSMARDESSPATTTWEIIYGVPLSLLVLLSRTTQLIKRLSALRKSRGTTDDPPELAEQCDMLEMSIMDFPSDDLTAQERDEETPNARIIRKTTIAFHHALIIYFAQNVRLLGHRYLQPYVLAVLSSIREIESIKDEKQILAAPLFWPAFIAASEAFDPATQAEFKGWYRQVEVYCIEAARTGTMVLERLWKNGPATGVRYTSQWMALVERTGVDLMLS